MPRLTAGGPHYYALRPDSTVGGEVYERELLSRLPAHGVDLELGLPRDHLIVDPPPGWHVTPLREPFGVHWTRAPLAFTPYVVRLLRAGRADLLRGHSVRHTGPALLLGRALDPLAGADRPPSPPPLSALGAARGGDRPPRRRGGHRLRALAP